MPFSRIADPVDLAVLTKAVDTYCSEHGVTNAIDRDDIASRVVHLFLSGFVTREQLTHGIDGLLLTNVHLFRKPD